MPTLDASWSPQIRLIGELERGDHWYLDESHKCYFFGEYTARAGYGHSSTNQIISNIKKKPSLRHTAQWEYKLRDMRRFADAVRGAIQAEALPRITFVPIPPSKTPSHPEFDSRIVQIARQISPQADVRELIVSTEDRCPMHESEQRLRPEELQALLMLNNTLCEPAPQMVFLVDDVITTGCSFVACSRMISQRFPGVDIVGIFAARRVVDRTCPFPPLDDDEP